MQATPQQQTATPSTDPDAAFVRDLSGFLKFLLGYAQGGFYRAVAELDLSLTQIRILHVLCRDVDEASLKELADQTELSMPTVSRAVDSLVQRDLVTRVESAVDRRMKNVRATGDALDMADRLIELRVAGLEEFARSLSPADRRRLSAALAPIVAREDIAPMCGLGGSPPRPRRPRKDSPND